MKQHSVFFPHKIGRLNKFLVLWFSALTLLLLSGCALQERLAEFQTSLTENIAEVTAEITPTMTLEDTAAPQVVETVTETPVMTSLPGRVTASSMWVRSGPGTDYTMIGGVRYDASVRLIGRTADNTWLRAEQGWLSGEYVQVDGDLADLPILYDFESGLPKPTPFMPTAIPEE